MTDAAVVGLFFGVAIYLALFAVFLQIRRAADAAERGAVALEEISAALHDTAGELSGLARTVEIERVFK